MKIWGRVNSTNVRKVLWCAEEIGLAYEQIPAGGAFGIVDTPEYRALNPNGLVPCLEDGGLVLWESNAIVRYLARQYGAAPFARRPERYCARNPHGAGSAGLDAGALACAPDGGGGLAGSVVIDPVPLPAGGLLLLSGFGARWALPLMSICSAVI